MRAMGLVQPHVRRTELCSLPRSTFDPDYLRGSEAVRSFVNFFGERRFGEPGPLGARARGDE